MVSTFKIRIFKIHEIQSQSQTRKLFLEKAFSRARERRGQSEVATVHTTVVGYRGGTARSGEMANPRIHNEIELVLRNEPMLKELHFFHRGLTQHDCELLTAALSSNTVVTYLDVGKNMVGDEGVAHLARSGCLTRLSTLLLSDNNVSVIGLSKLLESLSKSSSLTHLDLSENVLGSAGIPMLSQLIASCTSLTSLQLQVCDPALQTLEACIPHSSPLAPRP